MKTSILSSLLAGALCVGSASAFCGFYVAQADTKLFNEASKVVVVRDGDRTVLTMANDFQGEVKEFAIVFPVPVVLEEGQIHVTENKIIDHLDAYSAPRLVEYHDEDPCAPRRMYKSARRMPMAEAASAAPKRKDQAHGVTIEAEYQVGEYDILILSAKESDGLETWLKHNKYKIPEGASKVLGSYIKQKMKFFVAKVNLEKQSELGYTYLRPLQVAYESKKFALPIRLGTVNAKGDQELFAFIITKEGRVECANYKTVKLPSNVDVPLFIKDEFGSFYQKMFNYQVEKHNRKVVFLEYAWNMNWCDPCAADPLSVKELRELGCFWIPKADEASVQPASPPGLRRRPSPGSARQAFVTRLHVRYNASTFPEDLVFQNTGDNSNFQGRYILRHPWKGAPDKCPQALEYFKRLQTRMDDRATNLAQLTGEDLDEIRGKMTFPAAVKGGDNWWKQLWK